MIGKVPAVSHGKWGSVEYLTTIRRRMYLLIILMVGTVFIGALHAYLFHKNNYVDLAYSSILNAEAILPITTLLLFFFTVRSLNRFVSAAIENGKKYQIIMERNADAILVVDGEGNVAFANPAADQLFCLERSELLGRPFGYPIVKEEPATVSIVTPSGALHHGEMRAEPIVWDEKSASIVTIRDVTKRLRAESALMESERRYREVLEDASMIAVVLDHEGKLTFCNDYFLDLVGWDRSEVLGRDWFETFLPDAIVPDIQRVFQAVLHNDEGARHHTNEIVTASRAKRIVYWNNTVHLDTKGQPIGLTSLGLDITEQVASQKRLEWEVKVDAGLAALSHDIISYDENEIKPLLDRILATALELTGSPCGFAGYIEPETGFLVAPSYVGGMMAHPDRTERGIVFEDPGGLLGEVVKARAPLMTNDPANDPRSAGVPEGHITVERFLGVPALAGDRLIGMIGLANAEEEYTQRQLDTAIRLADLFAIALDRFTARRSVKGSETFLRNLMDAIPSFIAYRDLDGRLLMVNKGCAEFVGKPESQIIGKTWFDLLPFEEALFTTDKDAAIATHEGALTYESRFTMGSGKMWDVLVTKAPMRNTEGVVVGIVSVHVDITERERAREVLRAAEARFRTVFETSPVGIVQVDDEGTILYWNKASERILGYTADEAVGMKFYDRYAMPEMKETLQKQLEELRHTGEGVPRASGPLPMPAVRKDGVVRQLEMSLGFFKLDDRWNVAGIFQDVTERLVSERWLQEFYFAVEQSREAILITNIEGRIEFSNTKCAELVNVTSSDLIGKNICEGLLLNAENSLCVELLSAIRSGGELEVELRGDQFRDGVIDRWYVLRANPIYNREDDLVGVHIMIEDITERLLWSRSLEESNEKLTEAIAALQAAQAKLIRSEKLASLGQLSAGVAHEIKNPLNIISMNAQLSKALPGLPEEVKEGLDVIQEQVVRAVKITENLREFARERKPEIVVIELGAFIEKTVSLLEYEMNVENLVIIRQFIDMPARVKGDPDQLAQVFLNIMGNARDAMNEMQLRHTYDQLEAMGWKGELTISLDTDGENALIEFKDTGIGVTEEDIVKVFDPFFTTKGEGQGTGLGLSIAYGIIENHKGDMNFESTPGETTRMTIRLPLVTDDENEADSL